MPRRLKDRGSIFLLTLAGLVEVFERQAGANYQARGLLVIGDCVGAIIARLNSFSEQRFEIFFIGNLLF